ncbi:hypothetical protein [Nocardioides bruguierae]|uniref:Uncharacterized protein n=1 Tax=Nocardioides bruguierae TaxID=2945102 RepID=A0A9X2DB43_9ACTN|nr:hypothetical protein [Nocardioides bruguierae]MCM0622710.1 hypothetical protein [Nocardioides bruguierae]
MSPTTQPQHPTMRHPLTGRPLQAVGVLPNGRVVWPILGGDDTVPPVERPDGVSEEEWNALGDPGRAALNREREARQTAERALAASRARPTPPKPTADGQQATPQGGQQPSGTSELDIDAIVRQAVAAAVKPFEDRESEREVQAKADAVRTAVLDAAKNRLHDASDALAHVDMTAVIDDKGVADSAKVATALDDLVAKKPHLAKPAVRQAPSGIGGGAPANQTEGEKVAAALARMQTSLNLRPAATSGN